MHRPRRNVQVAHSVGVKEYERLPTVETQLETNALRCRDAGRQRRVIFVGVIRNAGVLALDARQEFRELALLGFSVPTEPYGWAPIDSQAFEAPRLLVFVV